MRYNIFSDKTSQQPVRVSIDKPPVKEDEEEEEYKEKRTESGLENEIIDSVPKTLKQKARRLLDKNKRYRELERSRRDGVQKCASARK